MGKKDDTPSAPKVTDDRFKKVHNDPRFRIPQAQRMKVKVDERFSKSELKKLNNRGKGPKIDRYGRKLSEKDLEKDLEKYYEMSDEDKDDEEEVSDEDDEEAEVDDDDEVQAELERLDVKTATKNLEPPSESDSESDSDSDSDSESESESEVEIEENKPEEGEPTAQFAVVNMDWDNIRAVDLFATFQSFVKPEQVKSVKIFPSEFGKEQLAKEDVEGPPKDVFKKKKSKYEDSDSDSDIEVDVNNPESLAKATKKLYGEVTSNDDDYNSKALRRYQLQRLRYYYAVVQCDSVASARTIYSNCDGSEYESTANTFDLRYIPDDMEFDEEPKDSCDHVPASYKPQSEFVTDALNHSKVKLTWDETPRERLAFAQKAFNQKEVEDMDLKAYLASDSEDEPEDDSAKDKYKSLLGKFSNKFSGDGENDDIDMEITFNPGLADEEAAAEQKREQEESTIDAYKRKAKERKKERMERAKAKKNKDAEADSEVKTATAGELELLTMDDDGEDAHFSMKDVLKAEKKGKGKRKRGDDAAQRVVEQFDADLDDDRFREVFESHDYAIDPTNSEFKKTSTMKKILEERGKRKKHKTEKKDKRSAPSEVSALVSKLKRKHGKK